MVQNICKANGSALCIVFEVRTDGSTLRRGAAGSDACRACAVNHQQSGSPGLIHAAMPVARAGNCIENSSFPAGDDPHLQQEDAIGDVIRASRLLQQAITGNGFGGRPRAFKVM